MNSKYLIFFYLAVILNDQPTLLLTPPSVLTITYS